MVFSLITAHCAHGAYFFSHYHGAHWGRGCGQFEGRGSVHLRRLGAWHRLLTNSGQVCKYSGDHEEGGVGRLVGNHVGDGGGGGQSLWSHWKIEWSWGQPGGRVTDWGHAPLRPPSPMVGVAHGHQTPGGEVDLVVHDDCVGVDDLRPHVGVDKDVASWSLHGDVLDHGNCTRLGDSDRVTPGWPPGGHTPAAGWRHLSNQQLN